jgi:hypothetical protein
MKLKLEVDFGKNNRDMRKLQELISKLVDDFGLNCSWSIQCDPPTKEQITRTIEHLKLPHISNG